MSDSSVGPGAFRPGEQHAGDRAVAILRELETHRTDEPIVAPMVPRLIARAFDLLLVGVAWFALSYVAFVVRALNDSAWWDRVTTDPALDVPDWFQAITALALFAMLVAYELVCTLRWRQTAGKKMLGMHITTLDGRNPAPAMALLWRTVLWAAAVVVLLVVPFIPPVARLLFAWILVVVFIAWRDKQNRTVFDLVAGTRVVCPRE